MQIIENIFNVFQKAELQTLFSVLIGVLFILLCVLVFMFLLKTEQNKMLKDGLRNLMRSFNELDEQAKLIVKTDLELNKAQEELDKRLNGLNALQKTSRLISTTLDEDEIFQRLGRPLMTELGFERYLILMLDANKTFKTQAEYGFTKEVVDVVYKYLDKDADITAGLKEGQTFSSISSAKQIKIKINQIFDVEHFILAPIVSQNGFLGILFVGNRANSTPVTEGDEELLSILANQIGQSVENARLFEQVYKSQQGLESKVQERTRQLAKALEDMQAISKKKSEFISAVSHELRTPLTSVKGYASILITGKVGEVPPKVKERLEKINKHSDKLVQMVNDLLDIARIESGRAQMNFEEHSITPMVENVCDLLAPQIKSKDINLTTAIESDLPKLWVDSSQFERVFINLIGNASKFTPKDGTVTVSAKKEGDGILFSVSDTGIGISDEDQAKLFDEFFRVDNELNKSVKGTGLGLALAKKIVDAHKGRIWIKSKLNEGTTFFFLIPFLSKEELEQSQKEEQEKDQIKEETQN